MSAVKKSRGLIPKKLVIKPKKTNLVKRKKVLAVKVQTKKPIRRTIKSRTASKKAKKPLFSFRKKVLALSIIACTGLAIIFAPSIYELLASGGNDQAVLGSRTGISPPNIPTNVKVVATTPASYKVTFETGSNMNDATNIFVQMKDPYTGWQPINIIPGNLKSPLPSETKCQSQLAYTELKDGLEKGYFGYKTGHYRYYCIWQNTGAEDINKNDVYSRKKIGFLNTKYQHTYIYIVNNLTLNNKYIFRDGRKVYFRVVAVSNGGIAYSDTVEVSSKKNLSNTTTMKDITLPINARDFSPPFDKNIFYVQYSAANPYNMARGLVYQSSALNSQESNGIFLCPTTNSNSKGYLINGSIQDLPFGKLGDIFLFRYFYKFYITFANGSVKYIPIATDPITVKAG